MQIERKRIITYRWWDEETDTIDPDHLEQLDNEALERIMQMQREGYTSGELITTLILNDKETEFQGWWELTTVTE